MSDTHKEETVLFFISTDDIDLGNAADRFVEISAALGADPDTAQMVGPLDLLIQGDKVRITLSVCDSPLATEDFMAAKRPEDAALDDEEVFTAVALHEAAIVLRVSGAEPEATPAIARLTACVIGRMPVAAVYSVENDMLHGPYEYLDTHFRDAEVRPRRVALGEGARSARPVQDRKPRVAAKLPDIPAAEAALAAAMEEAAADRREADLRSDWSTDQAEPAPAGIVGRLTALPFLRIFSHAERVH